MANKRQLGSLETDLAGHRPAPALMQQMITGFGLSQATSANRVAQEAARLEPPNRNCHARAGQIGATDV